MPLPIAACGTRVVAGGTPPRRWRRALAHGVRRGIALLTSLALVIGPTPLGMLTGRPVVAAPVGFDGTTTYTQDFQGFSTTTGTSSITLQQMAEVSTLAGGGSVSGWYVYNQAGWATGNRWFAADGGASSTGGFRSMYSSSNGNLALGAQGSGNSVAFYGIVLQNLSGATINNVTMGFDAVLSRNPSTTVNNSAVSYRVSPTTVTTSATSAGAGTFNNSAGTWTTTALGFSSPSAGNPGAPGTQTPFNPMLTIASRSGNLTGLNWGANEYLYIRLSESDEGGSDATMGIDNFSFSQLQAASLTWNLAGGGVWDTSTANFTNGTTSVPFANGDQVTFNNAAGGTIALTGALAPSTVTVSAAAGTYTFSGATAADKITGATGITKSGAGTLVLTSANDYVGGTTINGGTVQISAADQLGSGAVSLGGGTLRSAAASATTLTNAISVGAAGGTIDTGGQNLQIGNLTSAGVLTKSGAGDLTVAGAITSGAGTGFTVDQGNVVLGSGPTAGGVYNIAANSTLTGNLVLSGTQRLNVNDNTTISGSGKIQLPTSGALISNLSGNVGGTVAAGITVNSGSQAFTPAAWTGATYTPGSFQATIGATTGGSLTVTGVISGETDVDLSNSTAVGGGTGLLVLGAQNTYTGNTTINPNTPTVATANVRLGVANALPTTTGVVVGTKTGLGAAVLDLNGFNQQVAYLADGPTATVGATKNLTIRNDGAVDATLTLGGATTPGAAFGGVIGTGATNRINVVKTGANTQTLTGANTYTGSTTIDGGTLALAGAGSINASPTVRVDTGATFDVSAVTGGYAVANGQTLGGSGTVVGATTVASGGRVAPGPGIATFTMGDLTLGAGGSYDFQLFDATSTAGVGWDLISTGATIGLPVSPTFTINLASASTSGGAAGNALNFDSTVASSWRIIAASAFAGVFDAGSFTVNTSGFSNPLNGGSFTVSDSGATGPGLYLVFNPGAELVWTGGSGAWTATGGSNWSGGEWDASKTAVFNAPAGTVTIDAGGVSADRGLTFNADGYTIDGGSLTLGGTSSVANTITVATGSATLASGIVATAGIVKSGAGTLVVDGAANFIGSVTVTSGVVQVGNGGVGGDFGSVPRVSLADGTALVFNRSVVTGFLGTIDGGSGTVTTVAGDLILNGSIDGGLTLLNTGTATLTAAGGVGGAVKITNSGSGTIALNGSVTTTGAVTASGGTVAFGDGGLGSGAVSVSNNARLAFDGSVPTTISNPITIDATGGTIDVSTGDTLALAGTVTRNGVLTKVGDGTLSLPTLPTTNLSIAAGTLAVSATSTQAITTDLVDIFDGGKLAFSGAGVRVNLNVTQTGSGAILFTQSGQSVAQSGSSLNAVISNPIELTLTSGTINIGTTSGNTLVLNGPITGTGDVNLAVGTAGGAGTTVLGARSTFSGNVTVNSSVSTGVHRLGIDDALPTTALVTFGATAGAIDLAGFDQTIAGLAGASATVAGIVNTSAADISRLTINGNSNNVYAGPIGTVGKTAIELVKDGTGTQTLSGSNAYTGATRVLAGTLALSGAGSITGSSIIEVRSGATFDVAGLASPFSLAAGQTLAGAGTVNGPVVLATGTVSPGVAGAGSSGIGTLTTGSTTLGNGSFALQMTNASAGAGVGWDLLQTTSLVLPGAGELFTIGLASVLGNGSPGLASGFDSTAAGSWRIVGATDLVGTFDASRFAVNTAEFANSLGGGSFSVTNTGADGTGLYLSFTPVPEPSTIALLGIGIGLAAWRLRRQRRTN